MKISKLSFCLFLMLASLIAPRFASAVIVAPYTAGVHTLHLYHMDAAVAPLLDTGTAATLYNLTNVSAATGVSSYTGFSNALSYTANPDQAKTATNSQTAWQGADGAFTYEATIYVTTSLSSQAIQTVMARDHTTGGPNDRSFIFRLNNASGIEFINTGAAAVQTVAMPLPITGPNVFTVNNWYHIAVTYNGFENTANNFSFYWTKLDNSVTNANLLGTSQLNADVGEVIGAGGAAQGNPFVVGNRDNVSGSNFRGLIDEVRISDLARAADEMLFASPNITFLTQPSNQVVAVNQKASFSAIAKGPGSLSYQWYTFNATSTNAISGATNNTLSIQAGPSIGTTNYFLVATNILATAPATSSIVTLTIRLPFNLTWAGIGSTWDTSSANWTTNNNVSQTFYTEADNVTFNNLGAGQPNVDLQQSLSPTSVTVSNNSTDYLLYSSGANSSLTVLGTLLKQGASKFTIDATNNSTGLTYVQSGILQVGNGDNYGTLGSGPVTNNATLSFNRSDNTLTVANAIHGTGTVSFDGSGTVTVTGTNDYTGSTLINAGIANLGNGAGLGAVSVGTTVANGGQLYITANVDVGAESVSLSGIGDGTGALRKGGAGLTTYGGPLTLTADSTIGVDGGATITLNNPLGITGLFTLTKNGSGTLALNATNYYAATTLTAGVINVNTNGALGTGPVTATTSGRFVIGTGLSITNAFTATTVNPGVNTGFIMVNDNTNGTVTTVSGPLNFGASPVSGGTFVGPTTSGYLSVSGPVTNAPGTAMTVRFGNVRFSGHGDYPFLEVRNGTTSIGANDGIATNAVLDLAGNGPAFLDLNGFSQRLAGLKNTVTPGNASLGFVTNGSATAATLTLDLGTGFTYSTGSSVVGKLALVLQSGTQVFTGTNTYTGNTTVNAGTLELATASLAAGSTVSVANGAMLQLDFSVTNKVAGLVLGGAGQPLGVYDSTTSPGSGFLSGPGFIQVAVPVATNPTNITAVVNGNKLELSWPADHQGWRLQAQTNALTSGLGTNWVDVPNTSSVTAVTNTINPASGSVFYRMVYP